MITRVIKRSGHEQPFDPSKIHRAVLRCLTNGVGLEESAAELVAEDIARRVCNILKKRTKSERASIEYIQDLVEQELMAAGYFEAARKYILYREERRRRRAEASITPELRELVDRNRKYFQHPIQLFQFYDKYARWIEAEGRRETWEEAVDRVISFFQNHLRTRMNLAPENLEKVESLLTGPLRDAMLRLDVLCAMRILQLAGPALDRCAVGAFNCSYTPILDLRSFAEVLYILMQGTGVGFSVEQDYIEDLPKIKKQKNPPVVHSFAIPDTTEGWCDALIFGLEKWFAGEDVVFDFSQIRPAGSRLKTKGGFSSGPEPLRRMLDFVRQTVLSRQGRRLRPIDAHDICCMIGECVQVGGVRRAALISLSDLSDQEIRDAKSFPGWYETHYWRRASNNSAVYEEKPDVLQFMDEWFSLARSGSGERGIFNREAAVKRCPKRRKKARFGTNPCGEIILQPHEFCNLSIVVARPTDTEETLVAKARLASYWGTLQSTLTHFTYIRDEWRRNSEEERLLGVDITNQMSCALLQPKAKGREELLERLKQTVIESNRELAQVLGINPSAATTCVKPSGNSAQLVFGSSGVHPWYAKYYIRRCVVSMRSPIFRLLKDEGAPWQAVPNTDGLAVIEFPVKAPDGATVRDDMTAIDMLENWLVWNRHWSEHSTSCTIYVDEDEWLQVGSWVYDNFDEISGLSFLPKSKHVYQCAPYEEIDKEEYERRRAAFPEIDWAKLVYYETSDQTDMAREFACTAGACEIELPAN